MAHQSSMTVKSILMNIVCVLIIAPIVAGLIVWGAWTMADINSPPGLAPDIPLPSATTTSSIIRPAPHIPVSGRTVYMANCAKCHGVTGDGNGTEQLDRPARSFLAGGFSFGNTNQAIRRVVQHGIAGTPMPGFVGVLNRPSIDAVVAYVRKLSPPTIDADTSAATYYVDDRPVVIRGALPARGEWEDPQPRGILIGGTDGLTVAYDSDDVRLRTVRQGAFVRRTDWEGRGGTELEPLGQLIHFPGAAPPFTKNGRPIKASLRGTAITGTTAAIRYTLPGVEIEETAAAATHGTLPGYRRTLWLTGNATGIELAVPLSSTPEPLGRGGQYDWWIGGQDIVGIRGGQPGAASVHLPTDGTIDILVLPGADPAAARQAGVPLLEEAS
jgi:mono/diheme cytochrome c family protein